jgi:hypothetical integral membrane protein (TIGR02206 family)
MSQPFQAWALDHVGALATIGIFVALAAVWPRYWSHGVREGFRLGFALTCFLGLLAGVVIEINNPEKTLAEAIPCHLCSVSLLLAGIGMLRRSPLLSEWVYIFGIAGVAQAILTPDLPEGFPSFKYFVFFYNHGAILVACAWMLSIDRLFPRPGAFVRLWAYGTLYMVTAFLLNTVAGTNFGYLARKPDRPSLLDSLGPWPWYILWMQVLGIVKIALLLLPFPNRWALLFGAPSFSKDFAANGEESEFESVEASPDQENRT